MKYWKRWQKGLLVVVVVLAATAVYIFWPQGVWPFTVNLDHLAAVGEKYDATILRDTWGVPHIFGQTDADAAYGLAYAHAEDDFLTIQQLLASSRGQLGAIYGPDAAPNDYLVQLFRVWDIVDEKYDAISPAAQAVMQGYADGVNHYAALHPDEVLSPDLYPLSGRDVAAGFIHRIPLFFSIDSALTEIFAAERQRTVSSKEATNLQSPVSNLQSPLPTLPIATRYGSNAIAVNPNRSTNGETFLAVNAHQPWEGPVTWYEAHMHSEEGWDMTGALLPGSPTISHGHNQHLGWAFTVNSPDLIDIFVLDINPENPNQYRFDGEWRELEVGEARIKVNLFGRFFWPVKQEILWSVYGPTVRQDHGTYAIRYAGMGEIGHVEQFYLMNKASDFDEWLAALRAGPLPMFNTVYADKEGNIFYVYNGLIPMRTPGYDWEQYLPGDTSETLWTTYIPFDDLPQVFNPSSGFLQNSNNTPFQTTFDPENPNPADFPSTMGIDDGMSNRALRSLELFGMDESVTEADFYVYKYDMVYATTSDVTAVIQMLIENPPAGDANVQQAIDILAGWDFQATPDSLGTSIAVLTFHFINESEAIHIDPSKLVDSHIPLDIAQQSLVQAVTLLVEQYGRVDVPWSEVNRLRRGSVDLGLGGAPDVLHAIYGNLEADGRFRGIAGDSYVLLVTWDSDGNVHSRSIHQYGSATRLETSPHYADQAPLFVQRELKPVWFTEQDIRANLESEYRPGEELSGSQ